MGPTTSTSACHPIVDIPPRVAARMAGVLYLIIIVGGIFAEIGVRARLVVQGDPAATAHNIAAHELLYRFGFAVQLFYLLCAVPIKVLLYDLFSIVNRPTAILMIFFSLLGTAVEAATLLLHYVPLVLLGKAAYLNPFTPEQLQGASYLSLRLFETGFSIALAFFGPFCILLGSLILRCTFFPRVVGGLLVIQGSLYLINSFANFISPAVGARVFPFLAISGLGEVSFCLCLLVLGVNAQRWSAQAGLNVGGIGS